MTNYLNRPSIFEIARAYEDGNNGEIKPTISTKQTIED